MPVQGVEAFGLGGIQFQRLDREFGLQDPPRLGGRFRISHQDNDRSRQRLGLAIKVQNGLGRQFGGGNPLRSGKGDQYQRGAGTADTLGQIVGIAPLQEIGRQLRDAVAGQKALPAHRRNKSAALRGGQVGHQDRPPAEGLSPNR